MCAGYSMRRRKKRVPIMNDETLTPESRDEWVDALVDRGLRETLAGETPPDLRDQILAAARQDGAVVPASIANAGMPSDNARHSGLRAWTPALAAAIAVGWFAVVVVLPALRETPEASRRSRQTDTTVKSTSDESTRDKKPSSKDEAGTVPELIRLSVTPQIISESADAETAMTEGATAESLEREQTVGLDTSGPAATPAFTADLDAPVRQLGVASPAPSVDSRSVPSEGNESLAEVSDLAAAEAPSADATVVSEDRSGREALALLPGQNRGLTDQYFNELSNGASPPSAEQPARPVAGMAANGGYRGGPYGTRAPSTWAERGRVAGSSSAQTRFHSGRRDAEQNGPRPAVNAPDGSDVSEPYQVRVRVVGEFAAAQAIEFLNENGEVVDAVSSHEIPQRIAELERERLELDVNAAVAARQSSSDSQFELAVRESLADDPTIQDYRQQLFEIDTSIMQQQSTAGRSPNAIDSQRLAQSKQQVESNLQKYRAKRERELRETLAGRSSDELQTALTRFRDRRRQLDQQIVVLADRLGRGPGSGGDQYARIYDNPFKPVSTANTDNRLSTFSIDVDTAAYANVRQFLMQSHQLPPADAVRIEELVNYFEYEYSPPTDDTPFAANVEVAACPWNEAHRLVRIGIKGREIQRQARPQSNLVFLVDVSGSMNEPNKLPLVVEGLRMLAEEVGENDRVAIVVYASSEGLALPSTPGTDRRKIMAVLDDLRAGGSTAGGAGIQLAYKIAQENFIAEGVNRVILCTDGDFNVGVTSPAELERMAEAKAKETGVFLTVLGFGRGNLNDAMMERISGKGNGNYHYVDNRREAQKVLVQEMSGTLVTIAKDVKLQVEFNPAHVAGYRLIGYENRVLASEDFNDDTKDAGEIGAGHTVTALYEVVPAGQPLDAPTVDALKYENPTPRASASRNAEVSEPVAEASDELLTLKIRYKQPDGETSTKLEFPVTDSGGNFAAASDDLQFAAAVASFGMLLRDSPYKGQSSFAAVAEIAESAARDRDPHGRRAEFVEMVRRAGELSGPPTTR